jgi:hypothetical protein
MAQRRSKLQIDADKIIKAQLNDIGEKIYLEARATSREDTRRLINSINFRVKPDTTLTIAQVYYGKYNYPAGVNSGERNALLIAAQKYIEGSTKLIITEINDALLQPFKDPRE